jgi:hypothetical protein
MAAFCRLFLVGSRAFLVAVLVALLGPLGSGVSSASAVVAGPHWKVRVLSQPSVFSAAHGRDKYVVLLTNTGAAAVPSSGELPVIVKDVVSPDVVVTGIVGNDWASAEELVCSQELVQCEDPLPVPADDTLQIEVLVQAVVATGTAVSNVAVSGGGVEGVAQHTETPLGEGQAGFSIQDFSFEGTGVDGLPELQAAGHPYEQTTSFELPSDSNEPSSEDNYRPAKNPREVAVTLPEGFVGNPTAAPECPVSALETQEFRRGVYSEHFESVAPCPKGSRVGLVTLVDGRDEGSAVGTVERTHGVLGVTPLYNLVPEAGHPAEFGFSYLSNYAVVLYADLVHTDAGYRLRVSAPGVPVVDLTGVTVTLFGNPGARNEETGQPGAFLTNPARCSDEPSQAKLEMNSWEEPDGWISKEAVSYPHVEGCDLLQFSPEVQVEPETAQVDYPGGYEVDIKVPHAESRWSLLSSPELKGVTVTLPAGVSVSPSAADGLEGCEATGPQGIDMPHGTAHPDEASEGEAIGPDGLSHLTAGHCPSKSQIGEVEISTPLLEHPLTGAVYIAQPKCGGSGQAACTEASATNGELYGLYLEAAGSGVVVKLAGKVSANPVTGQLTTTFQENPELPVSEVKVKIHGGPRAPLANPQACGTATTSTVLEPWSAPITPDATPTSSFNVVGCGASTPFAPSFTAGTLNPASGGFSPFTLTFSRQDGEQDLSGLSVTTPPGLLGVLKGVVQCPEPQAQKGECGPQSLIGHTQVAAGAGSHPFWVGGSVYLTGPYKGAPFGLSVVVPAVAGPFNLGNVIVRAQIHVDRSTSALTVISDPLPQIIDGVPLRVKTVNVSIDRPGFMFNPTNCAQQHIAATITATQGANASVSSPFAVAGCKNLPFKPRFTISTGAKASKANGASLHVQVRTAPGEANIARVKVDLPKQLPSRLSTLQKACTAAVFEANPAGCPAASLVGSATATTPILNSRLAGPAYLVSHGGASFPDLDVVLQGEGVTIVLTGNTTIKKGITSSTFKAVPDAPVTKFDLVLPTGPHSILAAFLPRKAKGSLCGQHLTVPDVFTGQNGAELRQTTKIAVTGCPKPKKARHKSGRRA